MDLPGRQVEILVTAGVQSSLKCSFFHQQVQILGLLIAILRKSIPNLQAATKIGLIERVLCRLTQEREVVAGEEMLLLNISLFPQIVISLYVFCG